MTKLRGPRGPLSVSLRLLATGFPSRVCGVAALLAAPSGGCGVVDGNAGDSSSGVLPPTPPAENAPTVVDAGAADAGADATLGTPSPAGDAAPDSAPPACGDGVLN